MISFCDFAIRWSFYLLFLVTPLAFTSSTSELFEFNKMWVVFGFTITIVSFWLLKMVLQRKILLCRTPLDIPILLFLISQFISTIISLDTHVSLWGYYSRFNGGFLSTLSYILLYYAFVSNLSNLGYLTVKRILKLSLISGAIVALWGLPSHFGYDPTCLLFRGTLDVSCWTDAFQPKVRIFSTLGQPNWLAAYLAILIPIALAFGIKSQITRLDSAKRGNQKSQINSKSQYQNQKPKRFENSKNWDLFGIWNLEFGIYLLLTILFFIDLLYSASRSGFFGLVGGLLIFLCFFFWNYIRAKNQDGNGLLIKQIGIPFALFIIISLLLGTPSSPKLSDFLDKTSKQPARPAAVGPALEVGGTNSATIRKIVWQGALDVWKNYPLFGSGVETFAYSYYKFRPAAHNLTSEWDYLYNKAHNEYLNYLATTGAFGLGTYLSIIGLFFILIFKNLKALASRRSGEITNFKQYQISNNQKSKSFENSKNWDLFGIWNLEFGILSFALLASYVSILISNFFGFSVVMINLYFFLIPAFIFLLQGVIEPTQKPVPSKQTNISPFQLFSIVLIFFAFCFLLFNLFTFWLADTAYALGYNYDRAGMYQQAHEKLIEAVGLRGSEPVFKDELAINSATLAFEYASKKDATQAAKLGQDAIALTRLVVSEYPNNLIFWKTNTKVFYTLSQLNPEALPFSLQALIQAHQLAPTDAKIGYNLGVLYGQTGNVAEGIKVLQETIRLKPDYKDAYYALGLFYREQALDKKGKVGDVKLQQKAVETMQFILTHFSKDDAQTLKTLTEWKK